MFWSIKYNIKWNYRNSNINSFYSLFASLLCLTKDFDNNIAFNIPILMNKFYYFIFSNHCTVYSDSEETIDYFSSATLLSIYLFIWDLFINYIMKKLSITILLYVQISLSLIIIIILKFSIIIIKFCSSDDNCFFKYIFDKFIKIEEKKIIVIII